MCAKYDSRGIKGWEEVKGNYKNKMKTKQGRVRSQSIYQGKKGWKFCQKADKSTQREITEGSYWEENVQNNTRSITLNKGAERDREVFGYAFLAVLGFHSNNLNMPLHNTLMDRKIDTTHSN